MRLTTWAPVIFQQRLMSLCNLRQQLMMNQHWLISYTSWIIISSPEKNKNCSGAHPASRFLPPNLPPSLPATPVWCVEMTHTQAPHAFKALTSRWHTAVNLTISSSFLPGVVGDWQVRPQTPAPTPPELKKAFSFTCLSSLNMCIWTEDVQSALASFWKFLPIVSQQNGLAIPLNPFQQEIIYLFLAVSLYFTQRVLINHLDSPQSFRPVSFIVSSSYATVFLHRLSYHCSLTAGCTLHVFHIPCCSRRGDNNVLCKFWHLCCSQYILPFPHEWLGVFVGFFWKLNWQPLRLCMPLTWKLFFLTYVELFL